MKAYDFVRKAEHHTIHGLKLLVDLEEIDFFYPTGMKLKNRPKGEMMAEDHRNRFNGEYWELSPIATSPKHVYIVCPYCKMIHLHGNKAGDYEGFRRPHCKDFGGNNPDYYIVKK